MNASLDWWRPNVVAFARDEEREAESDISTWDRRRGRVAFRALLAFTFVLLIAPQEFIPSLAPLRLALVAASVAVIAHLRDRSRQPRAGRAATEVIIAATLVIWAIVTIPLSVWPGGSVTMLSDLYIKALVVFWLLGVVVDRVDRLRALFWMLALTSVPLALTGLRHYAAGEFTPDALVRISGYGQGIAANPNDLALTLDIILPLTAALLFTTRSLTSKVVLLAILCLDVTTVVATFSRGGFVTLAAMALFAMPWGIRRLGGASVLALVCLLFVAIPMLPTGYVDRLQTIANIDSDPTRSAQDRWRDTLIAMQYVGDHPVIGAGLGMDAVALNDLRGPTWRSVHNAYLNYGVDLGLPGLTLFVALVWTAIRSARRVERQAAALGDQAELATLAGGIRIALLGFAVAALFYPTAYHFYFYYLAGLAVALQAIIRMEIR